MLILKYVFDIENVGDSPIYLRLDKFVSFHSNNNDYEFDCNHQEMLHSIQNLPNHFLASVILVAVIDVVDKLFSIQSIKIFSNDGLNTIDTLLHPNRLKVFNWWDRLMMQEN